MVEEEVDEELVTAQLMYFLGSDGGETLMKRLDKGSFLLPAPNADGAPYVVLRPSMLPRLFRT